jgi:hypothetical protein
MILEGLGLRPRACTCTCTCQRGQGKRDTSPMLEKHADPLTTPTWSHVIYNKNIKITWFDFDPLHFSTEINNTDKHDSNEEYKMGHVAPLSKFLYHPIPHKFSFSGLTPDRAIWVINKIKNRKKNVKSIKKNGMYWKN